MTSVRSGYGPFAVGVRVNARRTTLTWSDPSSPFVWLGIALAIALVVSMGSDVYLAYLLVPAVMLLGGWRLDVSPRGLRISRTFLGFPIPTRRCDGPITIRILHGWEPGSDAIEVVTRGRSFEMAEVTGGIVEEAFALLLEALERAGLEATPAAPGVHTDLLLAPPPGAPPATF